MPRGWLYSEGARAQLSPPAAPFLLTRTDDGALVLIAPFGRRPRGPSAAEAALVRAVAGHLKNLQVWVDPITGAASQATIGPAQLERRMIDNASFNVRTG
jgi:hypothetical protein